MTELTASIKRIRAELKDERDFYQLGYILIVGLPDLIDEAEQKVDCLVLMLKTIDNGLSVLDALEHHIEVNGEGSVPEDDLDVMFGLLNFASEVREETARENGLPVYKTEDEYEADQE